MKKKGFTLIELLAVIVVLAIIALIATPIVMNTIKKSQKGAAERSADNYIEAVETAVATAKLDSDGVPDGTYQIDGEGNLTGENLPNGKLTIEMSGNKPTEGTITIKNGQVTTDSKMIIGSYEVAYNPTNKKYEATEKDSSSSNVVYRWSRDIINSGDTLEPSDATKYTKDPTTLGKNNYLKHVLDKDNKVTESYACAILNNKEYCLRGGDSSFYYTENAVILSEMRDAGLNCGSKDTESFCSGDSFYSLFASEAGTVVAGGEENCTVESDGSSYCGTLD